MRLQYVYMHAMIDGFIDFRLKICTMGGHVCSVKRSGQKPYFFLFEILLQIFLENPIDFILVDEGTLSLLRETNSIFWA